MSPTQSHVYVWEDFYLGVFSSGSYHNEATARITVLVALGETKIDLEQKSGERISVTYAVVKRSQPITIHSDGDFITLQYFPISMEYHALNQFLGSNNIRKITFKSEFTEQLWITDARKGIPDSSRFIKGCGKLIASIDGYRASNKKFDSRALCVAQRVRKELPNVSPLSVYAEELNLSTDRLSHLFKESFDVSITNYILSEKMRRALLLILEDTPFSDASFQAGFSDAAHFSRSTRSNFSLTPTTIYNKIKLHNLK
jgi:AraC-like DNA-binding protein